MGADDHKYIFYEVASEDDFRDNNRLFIEIDKLKIMVIRINGEYFAIEDICTHDNGPLGDGDIIDCKIICPRHGAKFDLRTGSALTLPAVKNIPIYPVRIVNGFIEVGTPRKIIEGREG